MMKRFVKFSISLSLLMGLAWFTGCGKGEDQLAVGTCQAGYLNTQYGCLPQAHCPAGQALYNNMCIVPSTVTGAQCAAGSVYTQYGCLPQNGCANGGGYHPQYGCIPATGGGAYGQCQNSSICGYNAVMTQYGCLPRDMSGYCQQQTGSACAAAIAGPFGMQCIIGY